MVFASMNYLGYRCIALFTSLFTIHHSPFTISWLIFAIFNGFYV